MRLGRLAFVLFLALPSLAMAQQSSTRGLIYNGSSAAYVAAVPDTLATTAAIAVATTTPIITGSANKTLFIFFLAAMVSASETTNLVNFKIGTGATCDTSTTTLFPAATATAGQFFNAWGDGNSQVPQGVVPARMPFVVVSGATAFNVCMTTSSTSPSVTGMAYYALR